MTNPKNAKDGHPNKANLNYSSLFFFSLLLKENIASNKHIILLKSSLNISKKSNILTPLTNHTQTPIKISIYPTIMNPQKQYHSI